LAGHAHAAAASKKMTAAIAASKSSRNFPMLLVPVKLLAIMAYTPFVRLELIEVCHFHSTTGSA
jgi:hypothetical protein